MNKKVWFRALVFIVVCTGCFVVGAFAFSSTKVKVKKEDCTTCETSKTKLIEFFTQQIIGIKTEVKSIPVSYSGNGEWIIFATYDTIPKQTAKQKILSKLDSLLIKLELIRKQDSINKIKSKT
jgi:hypothetical protein